jgi:hypothetical protein
LLPEQIKRTTAKMPESGTSDTPSALNEHSVAEAGGLAAAVLAGVTPQSTTADLAGAVPKEVEKPAEEESDKHAATVPDAPESSISPPGAFPETPANETQEFSVKPIPASDGISNPVSVPAGEKLPDPSAINANTVDSTATTSKEGYEKDASAALPVAAAAAGVGLAGADGAGALAHDKKSDADSFGVTPIPASSGIGNPISVPAGEKLPEQSSFNPNTVQSTVTTSEEGYERDASAPLMPPSAIAGATGTGAAAAAADSAFSVPEKSTNMIPESSLPMDGEVKYTTDTGPTISSVAPTSTTAQMASTVPLEPKREVMIIDGEVPSATLSGPAPTVPEMVTESLSEAHQSPEAAAFPEAVGEKALVENELLKKVRSTDATGEPAPSPDAAGTHSAPVSSVASNVPAVVKESISEAHQPAEAAAAQEVVNEKKDVESELLRTVKSTDAAGEPAPTTVAATTEIAPTATGDTAGATTLVSPTNASDVPAHAAPYEAATPGVETIHPAPHASVEAPTTAATTTEKGEVNPASPDLNPPATPAKAIATGDTPTKSTVGHTTAEATPTPSTTASPASTAAKETKHKKRRSFFGKLKDRLKDL